MKKRFCCVVSQLDTKKGSRLWYCVVANFSNPNHDLIFDVLFHFSIINNYNSRYQLCVVCFLTCQSSLNRKWLAHHSDENVSPH